MVGLIVPVMKNFTGFATLMASVDYPVRPYIIDNWTENHGVPKGWNMGIDRAIANDEDVVIISNDDVTFWPGTIAKLVREMWTADLASVVSTDTGKTGFMAADFPDFACFAIKPREFIDKFGYFDEHFSPAYFEDNDMTYRVKLAGGVQGLILDARVDHAGSVTQNMDGPVVTSPMFEANRAYYAGKWGGVPGQETYEAPFRGLTGKTYRDC